MTPYGYEGSCDYVHGKGQVYCSHKTKEQHKSRKKRARQRAKVVIGHSLKLD